MSRDWRYYVIQHGQKIGEFHWKETAEANAKNWGEGAKVVSAQYWDSTIPMGGGKRKRRKAGRH